MCTECSACEILKADRMLNVRLRMLIGMLDQKLEEHAAVSMELRKWLHCCCYYESLSC